MKFIECPQGSADWFAARCGKITASCFADAISLCTRKSGERVAGDMTAVAERYAADLAIERISGRPHGEPPKAWVLERGHEMEAHARRYYESRTGSFVTEAGICLTDDGTFGYSSDGLVDDDGLIEIKAPIDSTKILAMWQTGDTSEYDHQMQGGMWITGRKWVDFIMYVPDLAFIGKDLFVKRVLRDDAFIDAMVARLSSFDQVVAGFEAVLRTPAEGAIDAEFIEEPAPAEPELAPAFEPQIEQQIIPENIPAQVTSISAARQSTAPPTLRLGQIAERLGFALTADFLGALGFAPAGKDRAAVLFHESDFQSICAALIRHITAAAQAKAA